jgi:methionyl-tRNA formyltransferase
MIEKIIAGEPTPIPQTGEVTIFKRRKPAESQIPELSSLLILHDFIGMLDA